MFVYIFYGLVSYTLYIKPAIDYFYVAFMMIQIIPFIIINIINNMSVMYDYQIEELVEELNLK